MRTHGFLFLLVSACSGGSGQSEDGGTVDPGNDSGPAVEDAATQQVTLAEVQPVFDSVCTRCHATRQPLLVNGSTRDALGGKSACVSGGKPIPYVVAGHPEQSFLFYKIGGKTTIAVGGVTCAEKMPSDAPSLAVTDPDSVELVRQWILAGAP